MPKQNLLDGNRVQRKKRSVMLTVTEACNLRCRYCYEPTKPQRYMTFDTARDAITKYMLAKDEFEEIEFDFFGGEPLLAFDLIKDLVDWFHTQEWKKGHIFYLGTNGTILTEEIKSWLLANKNCVSVGVSLDGNRDAHNLNRSDSYDRVMENLPFFLQHWSYQPLKMTISAESIPHVADSIIEMEEKGLFFTANIVFEDIWGDFEEKADLLRIYSQQLERLVDYYVEHADLFPASIVDRRPEYLPFTSNTPIGEDCVRWCGAGHEMVMVSVDGVHYPCHRFSPWVTGRPAPEGLTNRQSSWKPDKCSSCALVHMCPVCAGFNWQENGDTGTRTTYHCESFKLEVAASAKLYALRILQNQNEDISKLPAKEANELAMRIEGILEVASISLDVVP